MRRTIRHLTARPRLLFFVPVVIATFFVLNPQWHVSTRALIAWNVGTLLYVALTVRVMSRATEATIRRHAALGDEGRYVVLILCLLAALVSLGAIIAQLGPVKEAQGILKAGHLVLAVGTIVTAFTFIQLIFAQHYAHEFYIERESEKSLPEEARGGLAFPFTKKPVYLDFAYFSFVIGCACQTSDVETTSAPMRGLVLIHGVIAFLFNTTVLALTINISSGFIGS